MPPRSPSATLVLRSASSRLVLPWSTWPITVTIGAREMSVAPGSSLKNSVFAAAGAASGVASGVASSSSGSGSLTVKPSSVAMREAVSRSMPWFMVAKTPLRISGLMMSAGFTLSSVARSPTTMEAGSSRTPSCTCATRAGFGSGGKRSGRGGRMLLRCFVIYYPLSFLWRCRSIRICSISAAAMRPLNPRRSPSPMSRSCASSPLWQIQAPRPPTAPVCTPPSAEAPYRTSVSTGCVSRQATQVRARTAGVLGLLARWGVRRRFSSPCSITGNVNAESGESCR